MSRGPHHAVAAVIPCYNAARYLPEAVASIRGQTVAVEEIIIVDDGSSDDTAAVVAGLGPGIRYLRQVNAGPSAARNAGIAAAATAWVALLDADDAWLPDKTERQLALLDAHPELALIASDRAETDAAGVVQLESLFSRHGFKTFFADLAGAPIPDALARLARKNFIPTSSVLMRRDVFLALGGFNPAIRYSEDQELWCRIAAGHALACHPEVLSRYRRHDASAVAKPEPMLKGAVQTMESLRGRCGEALRTAGCDPDRLVAEAWAALGYFHFDQGRHGEARDALRRSLKESGTRRALFYLAAATLPPGLARAGRRLKQAWQR